MYNFDYGYVFLYKSLVFEHLICPILSVVVFIFFDDISPLTLRDNFIGLNFTFVYTVILVVLNILDIVVGPYPFLRFKSQSIFVSFVWFLLFGFLTYVIALFLRKVKQKVFKV